MKKYLGLSPEVFAGVLLAFAAILGIAFENVSFLAPYYDALLNLKMTIAIGDAKISKALLLWINDGLMAIFFMLVAL